MRRITVLHHLYNEYKRDPNFEHLRYISRFVPGMGSISPRVLFIGASPSHDDNRNMLPFSGHVGHLLDEHLANINVERADTFTTNVIKYRTPRSRPPRVDEFVWSKRYLRLEVNIIKPNIIVTLGQYATFSLLPKVDLQYVHGQSFVITSSVSETTVVPMFGLQDEQHQEELKEDFSVLHDLLG